MPSHANGRISSPAASSLSSAVIKSADGNQPAHETSPLLPRKSSPSKDAKRRKWPKSVIYRLLLTAFLVSVSFGVTQVPLIYVFGLMTCDEYYRHHPSPPQGTPAFDTRCRLHTIEASTARAVALLGASTTFFGVANLFITGWMIKVWGVKRALLMATFWPAIRLLIQNVGVQTTGARGIMIVQLSQFITIIGGPAGYLLALNSYAAEVVLPSERTGTLGRLQGCAMFGTALGFLSGGLLSDWFSIIVPFRLTVVLFCLSALYITVFLPDIPPNPDIERRAKTLGAFFEPLRMFTPQKWMLPNGVVRREYGVLLLGIGAFLAVFATGYIFTLLQMYATDAFDFNASANSELVSLNFVVRATFLTFAFPAIITWGRRLFDKREEKSRAAAAAAASSATDSDSFKARSNDSTTTEEEENDTDNDSYDIIPTEPQQLTSAALPPGQANVDEPNEPIRRTTTNQSTRTTLNDAPDCDRENYAFDLFYARWSLILDGVLTALATFTTKGWQMYVVAVILPFAAGTGSAAKGTMLQMCAPEQKNDALSAISLVESAARLSTVSIFGLIFSAFANAGLPNLTFACNGACAAVGFVVLLFARFPPEGAVRYHVDDEEQEDVGHDVLVEV